MDKKINELIDGFVKSGEPIVKSFDHLRFFSMYHLASNFIVDRHLGTIFSSDSTDSRYVVLSVQPSTKVRFRQLLKWSGSLLRKREADKLYNEIFGDAEK